MPKWTSASLVVVVLIPLGGAVSHRSSITGIKIIYL